MAESYPNFESGSHESKGKKGGGKPEFNAPYRIEKSAGDTPLKFGDKILNARPLDGEAFKPAEQLPKVEETSKQPEAAEHERGEREDWRPVSAQELHDRAAADQQARLEDIHMQEHVAEADKESDDEVDAKKSRKRAVEASDVEVPKAEPEPSNQLEDILLPPELEGDGEEVPAEVPSQIGPDAERNPDQPAGTEAAFQNIAHAPELADLAAIELPEAAPSAAAADEERPVSDDEVFRDMIANETGEDPGDAQLHEQEPGFPPVEVSDDGPEPFEEWLQGHPELTPLANTTNAAANSVHGHNGAPVPPGSGGSHGFNPNTPNQPPLGGGGGNQPPGGPPNPNAGAWNNGPNVPPNPNVLNNAWAPAGNILSPAVLAGMSALEARQRLDSLRHTAREAGLAGAVGILGLGLVIEHFRINKTRRMLKKQGKEQAKALSKTNKALQREQYAHQATKTKLEHLDAAHTSTSEQLRRTTATLNAAEHSPAGAEKALGVGLISAAAAAELAANAGRKHELPMNEQLVKRLEHDRELGRAIKRNPELRDAAGITGMHTEQGNHNPHELAGTGAYANALRHEKNYEYLQASNSDDAGSIKSGGGDLHGAPSLPAPQQHGGVTPALPGVQSGAQHKGGPYEKVNSPWGWATLLFVIAVVIVALIVR